MVCPQDSAISVRELQQMLNGVLSRSKCMTRLEHFHFVFVTFPILLFITVLIFILFEIFNTVYLIYLFIYYRHKSETAYYADLPIKTK